jgi:hypothetical protein
MFKDIIQRIQIEFTLILIILLTNQVSTQSQTNKECNDFCYQNLTMPTFYGNHIERSCYCDEECLIRSDCCQDFNLQKQSTTKDISLNYECNIKLDDTDYIYSIVKCSKWWHDNDSKNQKIKHLCETPHANPINNNNIINYLPVYSLQTNEVYQNVYCAQCNIKDLDSKSLKLFQLESNSKTKLNENDGDQFDITNTTINFVNNFIETQKKKDKEEDLFKFKEPYIDDEFLLKNSMKRCIKYVISTCPNDKKLDYDTYMCYHSFTAMRFNENHINDVYKNEYCARCNGLIDKDIGCFYYQFQTRFKPAYKKGLQLLFDISELFSNDDDTEFNIEYKVISDQVLMINNNCKFESNESFTEIDSLVCSRDELRSFKNGILSFFLNFFFKLYQKILCFRFKL